MAAGFLGLAACGSSPAADQMLELSPTDTQTPVGGDGTATAPRMHWRRRRSVFAPMGAHMKSLSQLTMTPPHELTLQEIVRDRIALQCAKQHGCDEIEPENQAAYRNRTITDRSQQDRKRRKAR
jgi:hypothetical protein